MTIYRIFVKNIMTTATFGVSDFTPCFSKIRVVKSSVVLIICFPLFIVSVALSVLLFTTSDFPYGIFEMLFFPCQKTIILNNSQSFIRIKMSI